MICCELRPSLAIEPTAKTTASQALSRRSISEIVGGIVPSSVFSAN